jgi:hypothetical protein
LPAIDPATNLYSVTLTTTESGDIVPFSRIAMLLANSQPLLGQLFPTIMIACLVSLYDREKAKVFTL